MNKIHGFSVPALPFVLSSYSRTAIVHVLIALNVLSVFLEKVRPL